MKKPQAPDEIIASLRDARNAAEAHYRAFPNHYSHNRLVKANQKLDTELIRQLHNVQQADNINKAAQMELCLR